MNKGLKQFSSIHMIQFDYCKRNTDLMNKGLKPILLFNPIPINQQKRNTDLMNKGLKLLQEGKGSYCCP